MSRQALYELVWSKPMVEVAKRFNISDVALAKRCKAVDVPVPPRGWWARKAAGQDPPQTPLPKYRNSSVEKEMVQPVVREGPEPAISWQAVPPKPAPEAAEALSPDQVDFQGRLTALDMQVPATLSEPSSVIKRTAVHLRTARVKDFHWATGERKGPIVDVSVSDALEERALRCLDGLLRAAERLGWHFVAAPEDPEPRRYRWPNDPPDPPRAGRLLVEGEPVILRVVESNKRSDHVLTEEEKRDHKLGRLSFPPKWDFAPSGVLTLRLLSERQLEIKSLRESARRPLEVLLPQALRILKEHADEQKRWREQQRLDEERQRRTEELAYQARKRREAQRKLIHELERQAGAWFRARFLRRYVTAARKAVGTSKVTAELQGQSVDFLDWAQAYVEQLDPLGSNPTHPDQGATERSYHYMALEEALKEFFGRMAGLDGVAPWKLVAQGPEDPSDDTVEGYESFDEGD
jgi:hypothetical protein